MVAWEFTRSQPVFVWMTSEMEKERESGIQSSYVIAVATLALPLNDFHIMIASQGRVIECTLLCPV